MSEACKAASLAYSSKQERVSNKGESEAQHLRLSAGLHICVMAHEQMCSHTGTHTSHMYTCMHARTHINE